MRNCDVYSGGVRRHNTPCSSNTPCYSSIPTFQWLRQADELWFFLWLYVWTTESVLSRAWNNSDVNRSTLRHTSSQGDVEAKEPFNARRSNCRSRCSGGAHTHCHHSQQHQVDAWCQHEEKCQRRLDQSARSAAWCKKWQQSPGRRSYRWSAQQTLRWYLDRLRLSSTQV